MAENVAIFRKIKGMLIKLIFKDSCILNGNCGENKSIVIYHKRSLGFVKIFP